MGERLNTGQGFETVNAGEPDVEEDDVQATVGCTFDGAFGGIRGFGHVALVGEDGGERFADAGFVVNDEDVGLGGHAFRKQKVSSASLPS